MSIINMAEKLPLRVMKLAEEERFKFFLTGSRYFGTYTNNSDWDFFVEFSYEVKIWLEKEGFEKKTNTDYDDKTVIEAYSAGGVDIQLVTDVELKNTAQELLKKNNLFGRDKNINKLLWKAVLAGLTENKLKK